LDVVLFEHTGSTCPSFCLLCAPRASNVAGYNCDDGRAWREWQIRDIKRRAGIGVLRICPVGRPKTIVDGDDVIVVRDECCREIQIVTPIRPVISVLIGWRI